MSIYVAAPIPQTEEELKMAARWREVTRENLRLFRCTECMDNKHVFPFRIVDRDAYKAQRIEGQPWSWEDRPACPSCHGVGRVTVDPLVHSTPFRVILIDRRLTAAELAALREALA